MMQILSTMQHLKPGQGSVFVNMHVRVIGTLKAMYNKGPKANLD